jgi:hypothetical protein
MMSDDDLADAGLWEEARDFVDAAAAARRSVVDRFLLAIIDMHPVEGTSREQRLADAKEALLGTARPKGPKQKDDHDLLVEMAHAYLAERPELELRIPEEELESIAEATSVRELARRVARHDRGQSPESTEDRLRRKFASEKDHYIRMALHSLRRDESWCNSEMDDLLRQLQLAEATNTNDPYEF